MPDVDEQRNGNRILSRKTVAAMLVGGGEKLPECYFV